ncbi:hypothetical protein FA13DRAFT_1694317 [Coprinellus micaceus]|uniref:Protein kinase domain-containing protein n=1 Tax=Coprinellus micaceus TaxID=71717 RepID=A0A4Y7SNP1_COPMI|nr:hypothetical protein FA13DRAFT_1694317 [Coprinellus micaceus]
MSAREPQEHPPRATTLEPDLVAKGELISGEVYWKDHYEWLLDQGYRLRPRYEPNWKPSWAGTDLDPYLCEDSEINLSNVVNDATSLTNGKVVALKLTDVTVHLEEVEITRYLSKDALRSDPDNHSVPLIEVLEPPDDRNSRILVLPLLRPFDSPKFETKGEAIQFLDEFVTGVSFLHRHRIIHGDISINNVMMDASEMYPEGFHPVVKDNKLDWSGEVEPQGTRTEKPPKYYLLDFGLARQYEEDQPHHVWGPGTDTSVPEFQTGNPHPIDSFAVDVYCVGNMIRTEFLDGDPQRPGRNGYYGFDFLRPLVTSMTQQDPSKRPKMEAVVTTFREVVKRVSSLTLRSPCIPIPDSGPRALHAIRAAASKRHWWIQIGYIYRKLPAIPAAHPKSTGKDQPAKMESSSERRDGGAEETNPSQRGDRKESQEGNSSASAPASGSR